MTEAIAEDVEKLIGGNPSSVESWMPKLLELMQADDSKFGDVADKAERIIYDKVFKALKSKKGIYSKQFIDLCELAAEKRKLFYYKLLSEIIEEKSLINWKDNVESASTIIKTFEAPADLIRTEKEDRWGRKPSQCAMGGYIEKCLINMLQTFGSGKDKIIKKVNKQLVELLIKCFEGGKEMQIVVAYGITYNNMNWEGTERLFPALFKTIAKYIARDDIDLESMTKTETQAVASVLRNCFGDSSSPKKYCKELLEVWTVCMKYDLEGDDTYSGYGNIVSAIITGYLCKHYGTKEAIKEFIPGVMRAMKSDDETLSRTAPSVISLIYNQTDLIEPYVDEFVDVYLQGNSTSRAMLGMALKPLYIANPKKMLSHFDALIEEYEDMPKNQRIMVYMMFEEIAKDQPQLLMPHIDSMAEDISDMSCSYTVLTIMSVLSKISPEKFADKLDDMIKIGDSMPHSLYQTAVIICNVGLINQEQGQCCLKMLSELLTGVGAVWQVSILMQMKRLGLRNKDELNKYRKQIEGLKDSAQSGIADVVQSIIDFLEGRSLEQLDDDIQETKEDVKQLDTRVTKTEEDVERLDETVAEQGQEIQDVKEDVKVQGERLDELEEVVDETVQKVDEIDQKTIHNAPKWSRDVSKLLNPEHEYDWRYLAIRLGFTSEDIRNWALSPDPTMAILAEWYTIHKSSDATYAILTALEDMGRTDCTEIIEEALKAADQLIPRTPVDIDGAKPPKVFLSYQWDHQPEVKTIKEHLEMAGFACWMDIGQMGGGDQLFAKISEGMRASKVVLCMCTEKYSKSENCNKEVNLANLLNKPIIPILIDKMTWPPEGSMSMLFAQLLYIQFYSGQEYIVGDIFWEDPKFAELLSQISYYTVADPDMVTDEYRNWVPQVDDAPKQVRKSDNSKDSSTKQTEYEQPAEEVPQVFISYQWDKQPQIKKLYSRLTEQGFSCWLDINQMGGGDPLYTKIDKGIRNAKVVVSSVTTKYALSANCRREVSLTDALKKPIIPLLMEESLSWPPEGPMGMTFTQLLYIDFSQEICQNMNETEKFEELLRKLNEHATPMLVDKKQSVTEDDPLTLIPESKPPEESNPDLLESEPLEESNPEPLGCEPVVESKPLEPEPETENPANGQEPQQKQPQSKTDPVTMNGTSSNDQPRPKSRTCALL